jgi:hypothetical protein
MRPWSGRGARADLHYQIEHIAAGWDQLAVQLDERCDCGVVDVRNEAWFGWKSASGDSPMRRKKSGGKRSRDIKSRR